MNKLTLALLMIACGCTVRKYEADGTKITLRSASFLSWGQASKLAVDKNGLKIGAVSGGTEAEKLEPLVEAIAAGVAKGLKP